MMIDITNRRLDEVSGVARMMEKMGFSSRIVRMEEQLMLILDQKRPRPLEPMPVRLINW